MTNECRLEQLPLLLVSPPPNQHVSEKYNKYDMINQVISRYLVLLNFHHIDESQQLQRQNSAPYPCPPPWFFSKTTPSDYTVVRKIQNVREQLYWLQEEKFCIPRNDDEKSLFVQMLARFQTLRKPTHNSHTRRRLFSSSSTDTEDNTDYRFNEFQTPPRDRRKRSSSSPPRLAATSPIDKSRLQYSVVKLMTSAAKNVIGKELHEGGIVELGMNATSPTRFSAADNHYADNLRQWWRRPYKNVIIGFIFLLCIGLPIMTHLFSSQHHSPRHDTVKSNIGFDHVHPDVATIHHSGTTRSSIDGDDESIEGGALETSSLDGDDQSVPEPVVLNDPSTMEPQSMLIISDGNLAHVRGEISKWNFRTEQPMPSEFPLISSSFEPQLLPVTRPSDKEVPRRIEKRDFPPSLWSETDVHIQSSPLSKQIQDEDKVVEHESFLEDHEQIDSDVAIYQNRDGERSGFDDILQPEFENFADEVINLDIKVQGEEEGIIHSLPLADGNYSNDHLQIEDATSAHKDLKGILSSEDLFSQDNENEARVAYRETENPSDQPHQDAVEELQNVQEKVNKRIQTVLLHMVFTFGRSGTKKLLSATSEAMLRAYNMSTSPARVLMLSHNRVVPVLDATREASVIVVSNAVRESFNMTHQATEDAFVVASSLSNRTLSATRDLSTRVKAATVAASNQTLQLTREVATDVRSLMSGMAMNVSKLTTKGLKRAGSIAATQTSAAFRRASTTVKSSMSNVNCIRSQIQTQTFRRIRLMSISATRKAVDGAQTVVKSLRIASLRMRDLSAQSRKRIVAMIESTSMNTRSFLFTQKQKLETRTLGFVSTLHNVESYVTGRRLLACDKGRVAVGSACLGVRSAFKSGVSATTSSLNQSFRMINEFVEANQYRAEQTLVGNSKAVKSSLGTIKDIPSTVTKKIREGHAFGNRVNATVVSVASKMNGRIQIVGWSASIPSRTVGSRPVTVKSSYSPQMERISPVRKAFDRSLLSIVRNGKKTLNTAQATALGMRNDLRSDVLSLKNEM